MSDDKVPPVHESKIGSALARLKTHPITLLILAIGAVVAFAANFWSDIDKLRPTEDPSPLVRIQRFQVSGDAVSLMLMGKIDGRLESTTVS